MTQMRINFGGGKVYDVTENATPNRPESDELTPNQLQRNVGVNVPDKRSTKRTKIIWPERTGRKYGVGGSTGYRAARNIASMVYARETGCVTLEEYNQFKGRK